MPIFSNESKEHLSKVHPHLAELYNIAIKFFDFKIIDGVRTLAEQKKNVAKGVSKTMASKHLPHGIEGFSHAVDAMPYPIKWTEVERGLNAVKAKDPNMEVLRAYYFAGMIRGIALAKGVNIRQGIDWDEDGNFKEHSFIDIPHTELG